MEVSFLPQLRSLEVQQGKIKYIPRSIIVLQNLQNLDLDKNLIEGPFPVRHETNLSLVRLDINFNSFNGNLDFVTKFQNLKEAHLDNNKFTGNIPEEIGELSNLREFSYATF